MARKTVSVDYLRDWANTVLAQSFDTPDRRQGIIDALTEILHSTGNYRGFRYLMQYEVPAGHQPGIRTPHSRDYEERFHDTDPTRVRYY